MEQRLSVVTLGVPDLERARRFYEEGLGWRRGNDHDEVVFFQVGGAVLALHPRHLLAEDARVANDGQGFDGVALAYCARTREEVEPCSPRRPRRGRDPQARPGHLLGRLLRLIRRSRRPRLGGRVEPGLDRRGGRQGQPAPEGLTGSQVGARRRFTIDRALAKEQRFRGSRSIWGMSVQARARHRMPQAGGLR